MDNFEQILRNKLYNHKVSPPKDVIQKTKEYYPKPNAFVPKEVLFIGAAVSIIALTYFILSTFIKTDLPETTADKIEQNIIDTDYIPKIKSVDKTKSFEKEEVKSIIKDVSEKSEIEKIKISYFKVTDTLICGNKFIIPTDISVDNIIIPDDLKLSKDISNNNYIYCKKGGSHEIIYKEKIDNNIYLDTLKITFHKIPDTEFRILENINCPDDSMVFYFKNNPDFKISWDLDNGVLKEIKENTYSVSWKQEGHKNAKITIEQNGCNSIIQENIYIPPQIDFNLTVKSDYCQQSKGKVMISDINYENSSFILNNHINNTGIFTELKSGKYTLAIVYNNICNISQSIEIKDSLVINAKFVTEQDFTNEYNYHFKNRTFIDNYGVNKNVLYTWYINQEEIGNSYNAEYEFTKDGDFEIKLMAQISDDCEDIYTENITIRSSKFLAPNIFTPNDDGIGDFFIVKTTEPIKNFHGIISNRTGEVVFEWKDINEGWDGRIRGANNASEGVYFYLLRAEDINGKIIEKKGTVQLVRD